MTDDRNSPWSGDQSHTVQPFDEAPPSEAPMLNGEAMPSVAPALDHSADSGPAVTSAPPSEWPPPSRSGRLSIVAFVIGLLALFIALVTEGTVAAWFFALPALVVGTTAWSKRSPKRALAGLAVAFSVVAIAIPVVSFVVAFTTTPEGGAPALDSEPIAEPGESGAGDLADLTVTETAVLDEGDFWTYFATVENASAEAMWSSASFTAEAYDADGVLLDASVTMTAVMPGQTVALTGVFLDVGGEEIDSLEILIDDHGSFVESEALGTLELTEPQVVNEEYQTLISGNVSSTFEEDREYVTVIAVVRDADGTVVDVERDAIERVPAGGAARYQVVLWDFTVEDSMTVEAYARP